MPDLVRLFDDHHAAIYRYLVRLCGEPDLAADGAQEAFVRALERPPRNGVARAWLFTVATNYVLDHRRTGARRDRIHAGSADRAPMADPPPDPHESVESSDRHLAVRRALDSLPAKERIALLMREEGFSHREIADAVGTTTGSVGTLIARALDHLTRALHLDLEHL